MTTTTKGTTMTTTTTFEAIRSCTLPWCTAHLGPVDSALDAGDGWMREEHSNCLTRLHQHAGEWFELAVFETFDGGRHVVDEPRIDNRSKLDFDLTESRRAATELERLVNLAAPRK